MYALHSQNNVYIRKSDYMSFRNREKVVAGQFEENFHHRIESLLFQQLSRAVLKWGKKI